MAFGLTLSDVTVTITGGGLDDGSYSAGSSVTFLVDKVTVSIEWEQIDVSQKQALVQFFRLGRYKYDVSIECKWEDDHPDTGKIQNIIKNNALLELQLTTATYAGGDTWKFTISRHKVDYGIDDPCTLKIEGSAYGTSATLP